MIVSMRQAAESPLLSGASLGRRTLAGLISKVRAGPHPGPLFLDFSGVQVITSSFIREAVIGFRDFARASSPRLYVVVANADDLVLEELDFYLRHTQDAIWCCDLPGKGGPRNARVLGVLEPAEQTTFDLVQRDGKSSAPKLAAGHPKLGINPTAWNNRLASLARKGLLVENRVGKTKEFAPVLEA